MPEANLTTSPKQSIFVDAVLSGKYRLLAMGGGIRGTKTFAVLIVLIILCKIFPGSRWAIVRKDLPTLRRNTIPSIEKIRLLTGGFLGQLNHSDWTYTCRNGSQIILFPESFTQDPELDRWKGLEVNGFALEEADELAEASLNKARERAGAYVIPDAKTGMPTENQPKPVVLCTFNPTPKWPMRIFFEPYMAGTLKAPTFYLPSTIADNPWAGADYREGLKDLPEPEYKRFVLGDWTAVDDPNQLIKFEWVTRARNVEVVEGLKKLGVDSARYGNDFTVFCLLNGNTVEQMDEIKHMDTSEQARLISKKIIENDLRHDLVHLDAVGLGAGTVDSLKALGFRRVREIIAGAKPIERKAKPEDMGKQGKFLTLFKFKDLRSQMWWEFREKLRLGMFALPEGLPHKVITDLTAPMYEINADKVIAVEPKDDIKLRIGRSTDYGDALVMAAFDLPPAPRVPVLTPSVSSYTFSS
jgi:phage terminase large subunit